MTRAWPVPNIKPNGSASKNARRILAVRLDELFSYAPVIPDAAAVEELHNARIAAKRLRYTLELFPAIFGEAGINAIDQLKLVQDDLGLIHDLDVRIERIQAEIASIGVDASKDLRDGLESLHKRQQTARTRLHHAFVKHWQTFEQANIRESLIKP